MTAQPRRATDQRAILRPPRRSPPRKADPPGYFLPPPPNTSGFHAAVPQRHHVEAIPPGKRLGILSLTALGVVYGDIGTSPLYALQQCFTSKEFAIAPTPANVFGVLSLIVWPLVLVVAVKYIVVHHARRQPRRGRHPRAPRAHSPAGASRRRDTRRRWLLIVARAVRRGAALRRRHHHAGDLGARRGRRTRGRDAGVRRTSSCRSRSSSCSCCSRSSASARRRVGALFGPIMARLVRHDRRARRRARSCASRGSSARSIRGTASRSSSRNRHVAFLVLGAVVLAVTGGEALYADMGHFGKRPIRLAWFSLVLPALLLNYFGQGALLLRDPAAVDESVLSASRRACCCCRSSCSRPSRRSIASQALISGAFSLTQQAVQLGYSPRMTIVHTSAQRGGTDLHPRGQPAADGRLPRCSSSRSRSSNALGAAYGIAVTGTMAITSILFYVVARAQWNWSLLARRCRSRVAFLVDRPRALRGEHDQDRARRLGAARRSRSACSR